MPDPDISYVATFFVYSYRRSTIAGIVTAYTFDPTKIDRIFLGRIVAPGSASINPSPPERLMVPERAGGFRYIPLTIGDAISAATRGEYGLKWEPMEVAADVQPAQ